MSLVEIDSGVYETLFGLECYELVCTTDTVTHHATLEQPEETLEICLNGSEAGEALAFLYCTSEQVRQIINAEIKLQHTLKNNRAIEDHLDEWACDLVDSGFFTDDLPF